MNKIIDIIKDNKKKFYIILIFVILIIGIVIFNLVNKVQNKNKEIDNQNYVFTQMENNNQKLPYINIKNDKIDLINNIISDEYFDTVLNEKNTFDYNYYIEDNILYLFINIEKYNDNNIKKPKYLGYYININSGKIYNIEDILNIHNLKYDNIEVEIKNKLNASYIEETELGYVEKGFCNFECYLDIHDVNPLDKKLVLSYDGKNLKAYLNYEVETIYYVEDNPVEFPHEFNL